MDRNKHGRLSLGGVLGEVLGGAAVGTVGCWLAGSGTSSASEAPAVSAAAAAGTRAAS